MHLPECLCCEMAWARLEAGLGVGYLFKKVVPHMLCTTKSLQFQMSMLGCHLLMSSSHFSELFPSGHQHVPKISVEPHICSQHHARPCHNATCILSQMFQAAALIFILLLVLTCRVYLPCPTLCSRIFDAGSDLFGRTCAGIAGEIFLCHPHNQELLQV